MPQDIPGVPAGSSGFGEVKVSHNIVDKGSIGMYVQAPTQFYHLKGIRCMVSARCFDDDDTMFGYVDLEFTPGEDQIVEELQVFVPYLTLAVDEGEHDLKGQSDAHQYRGLR